MEESIENASFDEAMAWLKARVDAPSLVSILFETEPTWLGRISVVANVDDSGMGTLADVEREIRRSFGPRFSRWRFSAQIETLFRNPDNTPFTTRAVIHSHLIPIASGISPPSLSIPEPLTASAEAAERLAALHSTLQEDAVLLIHIHPLLGTQIDIFHWNGEPENFDYPAPKINDLKSRINSLASFHAVPRDRTLVLGSQGAWIVERAGTEGRPLGRLSETIVTLDETPPIWLVHPQIGYPLAVWQSSNSPEMAQEGLRRFLTLPWFEGLPTLEDIFELWRNRSLDLIRIGRQEIDRDMTLTRNEIVRTLEFLAAGPDLTLELIEKALRPEGAIGDHAYHDEMMLPVVELLLQVAHANQDRWDLLLRIDKIIKRMPPASDPYQQIISRIKAAFQEIYGAARSRQTPRAGLEEVEHFDSWRKFMNRYGPHVRGSMGAIQGVVGQAPQVWVAPADASPKQSLRISTYFQVIDPENRIPWEEAITERLPLQGTPGEGQKLYFSIWAYPENGRVSSNLASVVIRQTGARLPVDPNPAAPIVEFSNLEDLQQNLTPERVYWVAQIPALAGQTVVLMIQFEDDQHRQRVAFFA